MAMPQSKTDASKLKKYLNQRRRNALVGPPQTYTSNALQSLLDGSSNVNPSKQNHAQQLKSTKKNISCLAAAVQNRSACRSNSINDERDGKRTSKSLKRNLEHDNRSKCEKRIRSMNPTTPATIDINSGKGTGMWNKIKLIGSQDRTTKLSCENSIKTYYQNNDVMDELDIISTNCGGVISIPKKDPSLASKALLSGHDRKTKNTASKYHTSTTKKLENLDAKKQKVMQIEKNTSSIRKLATIDNKEAKSVVNEFTGITNGRKIATDQKINNPYNTKNISENNNNPSFARRIPIENKTIKTSNNSMIDETEPNCLEVKSIFTSSLFSRSRMISKNNRSRLDSRFLQKNGSIYKRRGNRNETSMVEKKGLSCDSESTLKLPTFSQSTQLQESNDFLKPTSSSQYTSNKDKGNQDIIRNTGTLPTHHSHLSKSEDSALSSLSSSIPQKSSSDPLHIPTTINYNKTSIKKKEKKISNENYVKLNLRNSAGSCRGARNLKQHNRQKRWNAKRREMYNEYNYKNIDKVNDHEDENGNDRLPQQNSFRKVSSINDAIDPIDDYLDGMFHGKASRPDQGKWNNHKVSNDISSNRNDASRYPLCTRHNRPCQLLVVKKNTTGNKGRKFYVCSMPKGEQCDFFQWEDDTLEAVQTELLESSSYSGFVARQVAAYIKRLTILTVPELRHFAKRRNLDSTGPKKMLLTRLSVWVRDQICQNEGFDVDPSIDVTSSNRSAKVNVEEHDSEGFDDLCDNDDTDDDTDDESTLSEELEICDFAKVGDTDTGMCTKDIQTNSGSEVEVKRNSKLHEALFDLFGYTDFREGQEWAIRRCLDKKRSLLVAPTGLGKSLCYALPAALMDGVCIVVSPLIALMEDQLRNLPPKIPAVTLSGNIPKKQMALIIDDIIKGRYKILFVSPEKLTSSAFRRMLYPKYCPAKKTYERQLPVVSLLCLDEAHCLSQWGHNFRSSYLRIKSILDCMDPQSVLALTATAGPPVISDICNTLRIENSFSVDDVKNSSLIMNCNRRNIKVSAQLLDNHEERLQKLFKLLKERPSKRERSIGHNDLVKNSLADELEGLLSVGSVIVYVWRKKDAEIITEQLVGSGISGGVVCYHGGMDSNTRFKAQSKFMRGKARICVATVAFGLGINKPDVRGVIHMCLPSSPENYLQEIGRAGRDDLSANAVALVLKSELSHKHSLCYSNKIAYSQVSAMLEIIKSAAQDASRTRDLENDEVHDIKMAIPITPLIGAVDLKEESIHTIFSLLEDDTSFSSKMLSIQGIIPDIVSITMKRRTIEELAESEQVCRCILECGSSIEKRSLNAGTALENGFSAYSFGCIEFSVTSCAGLLGPKAEPRNVYAALRRLQRNGELELKFHEMGKSIYVKMNHTGLKYFSDINNDTDEKLISSLYEYFSLQDSNQSSKVLEMYDIIRQISSTTNQNEDSVHTTELFQTLVDSYFKGLGTEQNIIASKVEEEIPHIDESDKVNLRLLSSDVLSIMSEAQMKPPSNSVYPSRVQFGSEKCQDYTALLISKIFHGICTPSHKLFGHVLWAKWRSYNFKSLHSHIARVVEKSAP